MSNKSKVNVKRKYQSAKGVLRACKRLFEESPSNWTTNMKKRKRKSANGGVAFCALGGIEHFAADSAVAEQARQLLRDQLGGAGIPEVNDNRGRKAILAGLDKAVA